MATNPALKTLAEFSADPAQADLNRRLVQAERNTADKTRELDRTLARLEPKTCRKLDDQGTNSATLIDCTDMELPLVANAAQFFEFFVFFRTAASGTGIKLSVNGPEGYLDLGYCSEIPSGVQESASQYTSRNHVAFNETHTSVAVDAQNVTRCARIWGLIRNGDDGGKLTLRYAAETAAAVITIRAGSFGRIQ